MIGNNALGADSNPKFQMLQDASHWKPIDEEEIKKIRRNIQKDLSDFCEIIYILSAQSIRVPTK